MNRGNGRIRITINMIPLVATSAVLAALRLLGVIGLSWCWVFAPVWLTITAVAVIAAVARVEW